MVMLLLRCDADGERTPVLPRHDSNFLGIQISLRLRLHKMIVAAVYEP
jgi:hypothetical protein